MCTRSNTIKLDIIQLLMNCSLIMIWCVFEYMHDMSVVLVFSLRMFYLAIYTWDDEQALTVGQSRTAVQ